MMREATKISLIVYSNIGSRVENVQNETYFTTFKAKTPNVQQIK